LIDRFAETGVGVDQQGQFDRLDHGGDLVGEFGERDQAYIGRPELRIGDAGAGHAADLKSESSISRAKSALAAPGTTIACRAKRIDLSR
jgi:hypothetical protein